MTTGAMALEEKAHPVAYKIGNVEFIACGDRVVIREDEFRSGYECTQCNGATKIVCTNCEGTGHSKVNSHARCSECHGETSITCPTCQGKGGLLVVPEASERRPSSGQIMSAGEGCQLFTVGEDVLYSNFAGQTIDLERAGITVTIRILHEKEILCRIRGHLELRAVRNQTEALGI
jgi:co-chaperonin GroES (HSP10)